MGRTRDDQLGRITAARTVTRREDAHRHLRQLCEDLDELLVRQPRRRE